jgi:Pyruvate/2-oxoacid:ferredoxin oxidoreductase gamma subunit
MMRGGNTDSTVVIGDGPIEAPPVVPKAWSAIAMHDEYWAPLEPKLRPGGLVLVNDTTFAADVNAPVTLIRLAATTVATDLGNPLGGAMVMLGAYAGTTGIVEQGALVEAMRQSIPPYRTQHIEANERALVAGWELLPANAHAAWERTEAHA